MISNELDLDRMSPRVALSVRAAGSAQSESGYVPAPCIAAGRLRTINTPPGKKSRPAGIRV